MYTKNITKQIKVAGFEPTPFGNHPNALRLIYIISDRSKIVMLVTTV